MKKTLLLLTLCMLLPLAQGCNRSTTEEATPRTGEAPAEPDELDMVLAGYDCEAACNNYVQQCLTLVPNATEDLFREGLESCMDECDRWDAQKKICILIAADCESMTDVCGL